MEKKIKKPRKSGVLNAAIIYETKTNEKTVSHSVLKPKFLLAKCSKCENEIQLDEKAIRNKNIWYHVQCFQPLQKEKVTENLQQDTEQEFQGLLRDQLKKAKPDPIQVLLAGSILVFLVTVSVFLLGTLSVIAMIFGGSLVLYNLITARSPEYLKLRYGKREPSVFITFLFVTPFALGSMVAYDAYSIWESPVRTMLLCALTITFWSNIMFVPLAVFSKYKEDMQPGPTHFPRLTILVPVYNEEKVIARTIESLIESDYPKKEIIVVDDGSSDQTLQIAQRYNDNVKILHKENGGKDTALSYGLNYANGEIIVIVEADVIIERDSLKELIKGFNVDKNVAAVAGNIKIRNPTSWLARCQSLEHITGIQIVRRAFDIFGTITVVSGAFGAFRRKVLGDTGSYGGDAIGEDFDATIQVIESGLFTQGSTNAIAYAESPTGLSDFVKQRKQWYRENIQVLTRHKNALTNPRFGFQQKIAFPYLLIGLLITSVVGFVSTGSAIATILMGDGFFMILVFFIFIIAHYLMTALALRIDREDMRQVFFSFYLVIGFKQLIDFLLLRSALEHLNDRKTKRANRNEL